jgi:2-polyprenyl-3-methyl-5-hydroxy-6-metoxy-1,4-benzoquinol methylase
VGNPVRTIDVGFGQGEFVKSLRELGVEAIGFDPVLRHEDEFLFARYWDAEDSPQADIIVMRCVLPHIPQPWKFLEEIATHQKSALVLIEFQKLEWSLRNKSWYQFLS